MANPVDEFLEINEALDTLEGEEKVAFFRQMFGAAGKEMARGGGIGGAIGRYMPAAAVSLGVASAAGGIGKAFSAIKNRLTKQRDYKGMLRANPHLGKEDASKVQMLYNSLHSMSPSMAKDPLIAGSFVRSSLDLSPESGPAVPPATAQMLARTQESIQKGKPKSLRERMPMVPVMQMEPPEKPPSPQLVGETHFSRDLPGGAQVRHVAKRYK